ncbi:MAG: hypothetical protein HY744_23060 [Deltaproteobacteria bacterium]|nr:hypothetical protein [Deltaproteobacteria bacterium]
MVGLTDIVDLALGGVHACALRRDGQAFCWGLARDGQLGIGDPKKLVYCKPVPVVW